MSAYTNTSPNIPQFENFDPNKDIVTIPPPVNNHVVKFPGEDNSTQSPVIQNDTKITELLTFEGKNEKSPFKPTENVVISNNITIHSTGTTGYTNPMDLKQTHTQIYTGLQNPTIHIPNTNITAHPPNIKIINTHPIINGTPTKLPQNHIIENSINVTPSRVIVGEPNRIIVNGTPTKLTPGVPTKIILSTPNKNNGPQSNLSVNSITSVPNISNNVMGSQIPIMSNPHNFQSNQHVQIPKPETIYLPPQRFIYDPKTGTYIPYNTNDPNLNHILPPNTNLNKVYTNPQPTFTKFTNPTENVRFVNPPTEAPKFTTVPNEMNPTPNTTQANMHSCMPDYTLMSNLTNGLMHTMDFVTKMCATPDQFINHDNVHNDNHYPMQNEYYNAYNYPTDTKYSQPKTKEASGFKFDKLDRVYAPPQKANDICYSISVYYENDENESKFKTSKHIPYNKENNFLNCDFQSEIVRIPCNNEEFVYMKVIEHFGRHESVVGRIKMKIATLPSGHMLRVPIMGDDGLHKGSVVFEFAPSRILLKELEAIDRAAVTYDQKLAFSKLSQNNTGNRRRGNGVAPLSNIFGNLFKWCCYVSEL